MMIDIRNIPGLEEKEAEYITIAMFTKLRTIDENIRALTEQNNHQIAMLQQMYSDTCFDIQAAIRDGEVLKYMRHYMSSTSVAFLRASQEERNGL